MQGDASTRAYELLTRPGGEKAVLMISPPRPDGPPARHGKPYSAIAHLAEDIRPFVAMDAGLRAQGLSAPEIFAADLEGGFAVLEYFGQEGVIDASGRRTRVPNATRRRRRCSLHGARSAGETAAQGGATDSGYDLDALLIEADLLVDWYAPHLVGLRLASGARAQYENIWRRLLSPLAGGAQTWSLRDYHSPNLIWLPEREGVRKIGLLDFQDCVLGPPAYDVVSLLQDARVTVGDELELKLISHYARARKRWTELDVLNSIAGFRRRLCADGRATRQQDSRHFRPARQRDGKPIYLVHIPRVKAYLRKNLGHPALAELKAWFDLNLPQIFAEEKDGVTV